jgi:hypothetical protein
MRRVTMKPDDFPDRVLLRGFEGGAVYTAERAGKFYLIQDESTMAGLLSEEDLVGLDLVKIWEFAAPSDRATYVRQRGWDTSTNSMSGQRHFGEERETVASFATAGSQRWLQIAVNRKPDLLLGALRRSGAIGPRISVEWRSPLEAEQFREYRDRAALAKAGIANPKEPLASFWPARGPVWDAIGITSEGRPMFVEAKAHIPEAASPATRATPTSRALIEDSLAKARRFYAPKAKAVWNSLFYQYANRLAHQYFFTRVNGVPSIMVFLYFVNADDMLGPMSEEEWHGALRLIHAALGVPADLRSLGVFDVFLDTQLLQDTV